MASRETPARSYSRRFVWLAAAIIMVVVLYTIGWFYAAGLLQAEAEEAIARVQDDGGVALCSNREARGYPFRIGLFCDEIGITDADGRIEVRGEGLRSAAQVYDPFRIVGELDALRIAYPGNDPGYTVSTSDMRFSASVAQPLPERASVTLQDISLRADPQGGELPVTVTAASGEAHLRRNSGDIDVAVEATDIAISPPGMDAAVAFARFALDLTVEEGVQRMKAQTESLRGMSVVLRNASVRLDGEAGVTISGPISVDEDGLIDASLQIVVNEPEAVAAQLGDALPAQRDRIQAAMTGFAALGDSPSLPLAIEKGTARIAFITLGQIPPVE